MSVFARNFPKRALRNPLSIRAPRLRAADKGARYANSPNCPKRNEKGGFHATPLVENRLLLCFYVTVKRLCGILSLSLSVSGNAKLRHMLPQAQERLLFHCLPPHDYATGRLRFRNVNGRISRSHFMTLSKITNLGT